MKGAALCQDKYGFYIQLDDGTKMVLGEDEYREVRANGGLGLSDYDDMDSVECGVPEIKWKARPPRSYWRKY